MEVCWQSFGLKIMVLSQATYLISVANNINSRASPVMLPSIIVCFVASDIKVLRVATRKNLVSCPQQQHNFHIKTWEPNCCHTLLNCSNTNPGSN